MESSGQPLPPANLNQDEEIVLAQINENIRCQWPQLRPHAPQDREAIIVGGGPSLKTELPVLKEIFDGGAALVATNGAARYLIDQGLYPGVHIILDSREFNLRFLDPILLRCTYILSSQCHPSLFKKLGNHPRAYQMLIGPGWKKSDAPKYFGGWVSHFPSCTTVGLSSIFVMAALGFRRQHGFGLDGCCLAGAHHAYSQEENDKDGLYEFECLGENWVGTSWMIYQAQDFIKGLTSFSLTPYGEDLKIQLYGNGLLRHIMKTYNPEEHGTDLEITMIRRLK